MNSAATSKPEHTPSAEPESSLSRRRRHMSGASRRGHKVRHQREFCAAYGLWLAGPSYPVPRPMSSQLSVPTQMQVETQPADKEAGRRRNSRSRASAAAVAVARDAVAAVEAAKGSPATERGRSHSYSGKRSGLFKTEKGDKPLAATDELDDAQREAAAHDASPWIDMGVV